MVVFSAMALTRTIFKEFEELRILCRSSPDSVSTRKKPYGDDAHDAW